MKNCFLKKYSRISIYIIFDKMHIFRFHLKKYYSKLKIIFIFWTCIDPYLIIEDIYIYIISTYNFVHKVSNIFLKLKKNLTSTYLSQTISLFQKNFFLKLFYSVAMLFLIALYQGIFIQVFCIQTQTKENFIYNII